MRRYYDGDKLVVDVSRAIEDALARHDLEPYSLLGVTAVLEAIASPLKLHHLQGIAGREMGRLGQQAYDASHAARRVALLQSPHSQIVNPMMESIVVALQRAKAPLDQEALRLASYSITLGKPRVSIKSAEKQDSSLSPAFSSALEHLAEGNLIFRTETGAWQLDTL
jgi:hypothetical protein